MENLNKVLNTDIAAIKNSENSFRDIYNVMFSHGGHIAYEILKDYDVERVTYNELGKKIGNLAGYIGRRHPQLRGGYIGIDLPNSPGFITAFWAVLQSGNKPYLVNSFYPGPLKKRLLERLDAKVVITDSVEYTEFMVISTADIHSAEDCEPKTEDWADEMAISSSMTGLEARICFFDGSSVIKQVLNATDIVKKNKWLMLRYNGNIRVLAVLPFFHIFGIIASYFWFAIFGRTIVFLQNYSPEYIRGVINRHQITHVFAPPLLYHRLYKSIMGGVSQESGKRNRRWNTMLKITYALQNIFPILGVRISKAVFKEVISATFGKSVQFMITGGSFIENDALRLINNIGYPLFNGYGTTEAAITSADFRKKIKHRVSGSIGIPFSSVRYSLSDEQTLTITGESICKRIVSFDSEQTGFDRINTSDVARVEKGLYYIVGRKTELFIGENGENISPDLIQNELRIKNATNFSVLELDGKLSLVLEYNPQLPELIIRKEVEKIRLDLQNIHYGLSVSGIYITRDRIANENAVKTSRALLKKMISEGGVKLQNYRDLAPADVDAGVSYDNSVINLIKELFQKSLDTSDDIDINANFFFDLGGTSLDYFMLIGELSSIFNIQINLEQRNNLYTILDIYNYLTVVL